jgi:glycerophosphoryl diester phosphodiesterase
MGLTRRGALAIAAGLAALPRAALAEPRPPLIFADIPVPDAISCQQAIDRGADFLVAPVAATKDGILVVVPDVELSPFTDVSHRPEFADRRRDITIDGAAVSGWFLQDFTLAELKTLAIGPVRANSKASPTLLGFTDIVDIARAGSVRLARVVGVSPRLVRPAFHATQELNLERRVADAIRLAGYDWAAAAMIVQSAEPESLKTLAGLSAVRRVQLVGAEGGPADPTAPRFQAMIQPDGLTTVKAWAGAIGPAESLVLQPAPKGAVTPTGLADATRAAGLKIYPRVAAETPRAHLTALFLAGVDGVMAEDAGQAARSRGEALDHLRSGPAS